MNRIILDLLRCPVCHASMTETDDGRVCLCRAEKPHCFDFAKSGHVHVQDDTANIHIVSLQKKF